MIIHPHPDPVAFEVFGFGVRWYGLMYLTALGIAWGIGHRLLRRPSFSSLRGIILEDLVVAAAIGVIIGGRLGYVLFYNPAYYAQNPLEILYLWNGGMSFHGGLLGVIVSLWILARLHAIDFDVIAQDKNNDLGKLNEEDKRVLKTVTNRQIIFLRLVDLAAVLTPPGLALGRLGNFINAELPGRVTSPDLPWAMSFGIPDYLPRHPSQLYQMFLEGFLLAALLLWLARTPRPPGWLAGFFLLAYGAGRFLTEFFREPDAHLGAIAAGLTMGQLLCLPMMLIGIALINHQRLTAWRQDKKGGNWRDRLSRALTAEPNTTWSEHERAYAEDYGEDEEDVPEEGGRIGGFFRSLFRGDAEEEEYIITRYQLTRRQKRRLKKKKRK